MVAKSIILFAVLAALSSSPGGPVIASPTFLRPESGGGDVANLNGTPTPESTPDGSPGPTTRGVEDAENAGEDSLIERFWNLLGPHPLPSSPPDLEEAEIPETPKRPSPIKPPTARPQPNPPAPELEPSPAPVPTPDGDPKGEIGPFPFRDGRFYPPGAQPAKNLTPLPEKYFHVDNLGIGLDPAKSIIPAEVIAKRFPEGVLFWDLSLDPDHVGHILACFAPYPDDSDPANRDRLVCRPTVDGLRVLTRKDGRPWAFAYPNKETLYAPTPAPTPAPEDDGRNGIWFNITAERRRRKEKGIILDPLFPPP